MFPNTQWTQLAQATLHGEAHGRAAMESLCRTYWEPVRAYVLYRGWPKDEAPDLTQAFFLYLMEHSVLRRVDRERGKFRAFLQGVLSHFLISELRQRQRQKRGGGKEHVTLDDVHEDLAVPGEHVEYFDRQWAAAIMKACVTTLHGECAAKRGTDAAALLMAYAGGAGEALSYADASTRLQLPESAFRSEVLNWRRRLRELLRMEVQRTVSAPHEVAEEMSYLHRLLVN
jgi:DNA-directed RNA polymerase specialized sigma24 family protein